MTRKQWEEKVLKELKENDGRTSIFSVTRNQFVANAFCRLEASGKIKRIDNRPYPWMKFRIIN